MRRHYYLRQVAPSAAAPAAEPPPAATEAPARPEPLIGSKAIAARLGLSVQQLYRLRSPGRNREPAAAPIRDVPGIGMVADGQVLDAWWARYLRGAA